MTTQDIIDHLKAGRPVTAKVVKEVVAALEFSRRQDAELKRLLAMQSDLDLQGYEHMRGELQELRGWFRGRPSKKIGYLHSEVGSQI